MFPSLISMKWLPTTTPRCCGWRRCIDERGEDQDWLFGEVDFIRDWVVSSQNHSLADTVVYTDGRPVEAIALDIAKRVQE